MNNTQLKKIEILSNLSIVPNDKLDDISSFIKYILYTTRVKQKKPISVRGIWENMGFENIDVEKELKNIRQEIQSNLDHKKI